MGHPVNPALHLGSNEDLPINQELTFSLKSHEPFPRTAKIEIANADETLRTDLTVAAGTPPPRPSEPTHHSRHPRSTQNLRHLRLRPSPPPRHLPRRHPRRLAPPHHPRPSSHTRHPHLRPPDPTTLCTLTGAKLYLIESISTNADFTTPITIPDGFVASAISVPRPAELATTRSKSRPTSTTLYLRLRDDPIPTNSATIQVVPLNGAMPVLPAPYIPIPLQPDVSTQPTSDSVAPKPLLTPLHHCCHHTNPLK